MNRKALRSVILVVALILLTLFLFRNYGYSVTEEMALRHSFPFQDGDILYENDYGNETVFVWKSSDTLYGILVMRKWGFLYHVSNFNQLHPMSPLEGDEGVLNRIWSADLNKDEKYDTLFAVEALDAAIKTVIISNDNIDDVIADEVEQIKANSNVYIELTIENGVAAAYSELNIEDAGGFVFRGVNDKGEVILIGI